MSKQLTVSAVFSTVAMAVMALAMSFGPPASEGAARGATAHGSIVSVLLGA